MLSRVLRRKVQSPWHGKAGALTSVEDLLSALAGLYDPVAVAHFTQFPGMFLQQLREPFLVKALVVNIRVHTVISLPPATTSSPCV